MAAYPTADAYLAGGGAIGLGDTGAPLYQIRSALEAKGFHVAMSVADPMLFDTELSSRVATFQGSVGLPATGAVDLATWQALGLTINTLSSMPGAGPVGPGVGPLPGLPELSGSLKMLLGVGLAAGVWWLTRTPQGRSKAMGFLSDVFSPGYRLPPPGRRSRDEDEGWDDDEDEAPPPPKPRARARRASPTKGAPAGRPRRIKPKATDIVMSPDGQVIRGAIQARGGLR